MSRAIGYGITVAALAFVASLRASPSGHHGTGPGRGVQSLDVYAEGGRVHLLVGEYDEHGAVKLLASLSSDGGRSFSAAVRVDVGLPAAQGARRGMDPQIVVSGDRVVAAWMTRGTGMFDSGPIATAISGDGGKTWAPGPNPADDGSTGGHGFLDLVRSHDGALHCVWLDDREGERGLRSSRSLDGGLTWEKNRTVDERTCECCWNTFAASRTSPATAVLYRDADPRDMSIAIQRDGSTPWVQNGAVGQFKWNFQGCPHVGGGLAFGKSASTRETLHASVWTGEEAQAGLYVMASRDLGATWTKPSRIGGKDARHSDLSANDDGTVIVAWDTKRDSGAGDIWVAASDNSGTTWNAPRKLASAPGASHPRIVQTNGKWRCFWTQSGPDDHAPAIWSSAEL